VKREADAAAGERSRPSDGVDWRQVRGLLVAGIKLDLRTSHAQHRSLVKIPPLVKAIFTYAIMGTVLAVALSQARDPFIYSLFTMSAAMFMTGLSVIMEYSAVVVNPDDYEVLAHRPISSSTYFWAKIANLLFYVIVMALALGLPAAITGGLTMQEGLAFSFAYILSALGACAATAAFIVVIYATALKLFDYRRFMSAITYVHMLVTIVIVFAYIGLPRMLGSDAPALSFERGPWVYWTPSAWFAGAVEALVGLGTRQSAVLAALGVVSIVALIALAQKTVSLGYSRRIAELAATPSPSERPRTSRRRGVDLARIGLSFCTNDEERAGYLLMSEYMKRDRKLRSRVYPAFGLPLAVYIFGLVTDGLYDPFRDVPPETGFPVQDILGFYCVFVSLFFATAVTQSDEWKASWVFYASPVTRRAGVMIGARKLITFRYLLPFFALLFVLLSFRIPVASAALYMFIVSLLSLTAFALLSLATPHLPLSQSIEKTRQARQIGLIFILGIAMGFSVAARDAIRESPAAVAWILVVLGLALVGSEWLLRRRLQARLAGEEYGG